jgi:hypothetical protein
LDLTLNAFFSVNLDAPTPAHAALVASLGADCNAKVAYSGVHHHAGRADAVERASDAMGVRSSAPRTRVNDNRRNAVILHPQSPMRQVLLVTLVSAVTAVVLASSATASASKLTVGSYPSTRRAFSALTDAWMGSTRKGPAPPEFAGVGL